MRIQYTIGLALGLCVLAGAAGAQNYGTQRGNYSRGNYGQTFECASVRNDYRECAVPGRGWAVLTQQISKNACIEGRTWGQRNGTVWVQKGCRAQFRVGRGNGNGYGRRDRRDNYGATSSFICESIDGRQNYCNTGTRANVSFRRQISKSACIEGRTWGIDRRGVWVAGGCRAEFEVRGY